ncbi:Nucleoside diphosphate kinase 7 [Folsomia candida]|uniref:Nucleoside diphosphate kinase 7 n=1 Tax=Folsomia candida TaxID=158441 RepID=A0A226EIJ5_FOLCA|nr:Nucleoside diphosphate kinase 7 [Folsomia candida]
MCSKNTCPGANSFPQLTDVLPVCNPCDGIGYKAPFRKEIPFKLTFIVQWYIEKLELEKKFLLSYYDFDGTIELKDLDNQRPFLRRMRLDTVKVGELFLGNKLLILSRQLVVLDYGDGLTKEYCEPKCERAFIMVRPEAMDNLPCIISRLEKCFRILRGKIFTIPQNMAYELSSEFTGEENFLESVRSLDGKNVAVFLLMAENALEKMKNLVGSDKNPKEAMLKNHQSLRSLFGMDELRNGFFFSESPGCVLKQASQFFSDCPTCVIPSFFLMNGQTTCCVIKPHIMREGRAGVVLTDVVACGFKIISLGVFWLNRRQAEEFYEIYQRIYIEAEFMAMVDELGVGPCMVVELSHTNASSDCNAVEAFRHFCGPADSDLARKVKPQTLRARHGLNKIQNAIHCTELPEDAYYELEYFFKILDHKCNGVKSVTGVVPLMATQ